MRRLGDIEARRLAPAPVEPLEPARISTLMKIERHCETEVPQRPSEG